MKRANFVWCFLGLVVIVVCGCEIPAPSNQSNIKKGQSGVEEKPTKEIIEKEVMCNCVDNCWSGAESLRRMTLKGAFPLETKEEAEYFLHQYKPELVVDSLVPCKILQGKKCWRFSFDVPTIKKDGKLYSGCSYWGELDAQTGYINEGIGGGAVRTSQ